MPAPIRLRRRPPIVDAMLVVDNVDEVNRLQAWVNARRPGAIYRTGVTLQIWVGLPSPDSPCGWRHLPPGSYLVRDAEDNFDVMTVEQLFTLYEVVQ